MLLGGSKGPPGLGSHLEKESPLFAHFNLFVNKPRFHLMGDPFSSLHNLPFPASPSSGNPNCHQSLSLPFCWPGTVPRPLPGQYRGALPWWPSPVIHRLETSNYLRREGGYSDQSCGTSDFRSCCTGGLSQETLSPCLQGSLPENPPKEMCAERPRNCSLHPE